MVDDVKRPTHVDSDDDSAFGRSTFVKPFGDDVAYMLECCGGGVHLLMALTPTPGMKWVRRIACRIGAKGINWDDSNLYL